MHLIVAVDKNWAIGKNNKLMWSIPADMKYFRETTKGNIVIMGRKTLESFPQSQPLKNRVNIVITNNKDYKVKDAVVVHSIEEALEEAKKEAAVEKVKDIIAADGEVSKADVWGMRKLAYPIQKKNEGYYVVIEFAGSTELPKELDRRLRISDDVMRHIIINKDAK